MLKIIFCFLACLVFFLPLALSQNTEDLTFTTYYPSPFGSFVELAANRFVVGGDTVPAAQGVVNFSPKSQPASGNAGDIYYDTGNNFWFHNGTQWNRFGGGTLRVISAKRFFNNNITFSPGSSLDDFVILGNPFTASSGGGAFDPSWVLSGSSRWGIGCNAARGWQATGCSLGTNLGAGSDGDERYIFDNNGNSGCVSDSEEAGGGVQGRIYVICARIQ